MVFCPECGKEIEPDVKFCLYCGANLNSAQNRLKKSEESQVPSYQETQQPQQPTIKEQYSGDQYQYSHHQRHQAHYERHYQHRQQRQQRRDERYNSRQNRSRGPGRGIGIFVLLLVIFGAGLFGGLAFGTWGSIQQDLHYSYIGDNIAETQSLVIDGSTQDLVYKFNTTEMNEYIKVDLSIDVSGSFLDDKVLSDLYDISWENQSAIKKLTIKSNPFRSIIFRDYSNIEVTLRSDLSYSFQSDISTGDISLNTVNSLSLADVDFETDTGKITLNIGDNSNISGEIICSTITGNVIVDIGDYSSVAEGVSIRTDTGDIRLMGEYSEFDSDIRLETSTGDLDMILPYLTLDGNLMLQASTGHILITLTNTNYISDSNWWINASTGDIRFNLQQNSAMNNDVFAEIETSTGDIGFNYQVNGTLVGSKFDIIHFTTGDVDWDASGFTDSDPYTSIGFASAANSYIFELSVSTGDFEGTLTSY